MKYLLAFLLIVIASTFCLIAWDDIYGNLTFLPEKIRALNFFDMSMLQLFMSLLALWGAHIATEKIKRKIAAGNAIGSVSCQLINLSPIDVPVLQPGEDVPSAFGRLFLLSWMTTGSFAPKELADICGSEVATNELTKDFESAIEPTSIIAPIFKSKISLFAFNRLLDKFCALAMGQKGDLKPYVVVLAAEEPAPEKLERLFVLPPALLLLFSGEFDYSKVVTIREVQSYRAMALRILAEQLLSCPVELSEWSGFQSGIVYGVRKLPAVGAAKGFDWWNKKWNLNPRKKYTKAQLKEMREALISALQNAEGEVDNEG